MAFALVEDAGMTDAPTSAEIRMAIGQVGRLSEELSQTERFVGRTDGRNRNQPWAN
jgi:hypothetical protein